MSDTKKILIIEDDLTLSQALNSKFVTEGFSVITALNGSDGLTSALTNHPDLILLDILMPEINGMTVLKKLRQDVWGAKVPVILFSNLDDSANRIEAMEYKADFFVKSNTKLDDIVKKVHEKLHNG